MVCAVSRWIWGGGWGWWKFVAFWWGKWFEGWYNTDGCYCNDALTYFVVEIQGFYLFIFACFVLGVWMFFELSCKFSSIMCFMHSFEWMQKLSEWWKWMFLLFLWSCFIFDSFGEKILGLVEITYLRSENNRQSFGYFLLLTWICYFNYDLQYDFKPTVCFKLLFPSIFSQM